jgi:hypothetical protein
MGPFNGRSSIISLAQHSHLLIKSRGTMVTRMMKTKTDRNHDPTGASRGDDTMADDDDSRTFLKNLFS